MKPPVMDGCSRPLREVPAQPPPTNHEDAAAPA